MPARRKPSPAARRPAPSRAWSLQDAKARFSELVRRARDEGPQRVTIHGRPAVVVIADGGRGRPGGARRTLRDLMFDSPFRDFDFAPVREKLHVRRVRI
jgi:prevent-host-death family protein